MSSRGRSRSRSRSPRRSQRREVPSRPRRDEPEAPAPPAVRDPQNVGVLDKRRFVARVIDIVLLRVLLAVAVKLDATLFSVWRADEVAPVVARTPFLLLQMLVFGSTLGKLLVGLEVCDKVSRRRCWTGKLMLRELAFVLSREFVGWIHVSLPYVLLFAELWRGEFFHDNMCSSCVIERPRLWEWSFIR